MAIQLWKNGALVVEFCSHKAHILNVESKSLCKGLNFIKVGIIISNDSTQKTMPMKSDVLIVQDLRDILQILQERVKAYNASAYNTENLQLKMLLHRELDNTRDCIIGIKRLLIEHFEGLSQEEITGHLFGIWSDFKPSFSETDLDLQFESFEMADLLTIQCYQLILSRPYLDSNSRNLLEFQYQNNLTVFKSIKNFRMAHSNMLSHATGFQSQRRAYLSISHQTIISYWPLCTHNKSDFSVVGSLGIFKSGL